MCLSDQDINSSSNRERKADAVLSHRLAQVSLTLTHLYAQSLGITRRTRADAVRGDAFERRSRERG